MVIYPAVAASTIPGITIKTRPTIWPNLGTLIFSADLKSTPRAIPATIDTSRMTICVIKTPHMPKSNCSGNPKTFIAIIIMTKAATPLSQ